MPFLVKNRVSEWKCCIFFSSAVFFFRLLNLREWVDFKLFLGKKTFFGFCFFFLNTFPKFEKIRKVPKNSIKYLFLDLFFCRYLIFFEWVACKLFLGKKKFVFFFSKKWRKKKYILSTRVNEWGVNYFRKKIILYLCVWPPKKNPKFVVSQWRGHPTNIKQKIFVCLS